MHVAVQKDPFTFCVPSNCWNPLTMTIGKTLAVLLVVFVAICDAFTPVPDKCLPNVLDRKRSGLFQSSRSAADFVDSGSASVGATTAPTSGANLVLKNASNAYSYLTSEYYLLMAFLQSGCLASAADMATQTMEHAGPIDFGHVTAMATVASTMSGAVNAVWLKQLEQAFPGTGSREVASKTLIHAVILASIINSAYLVGVPLFHEYFYTGAFEVPPANPAIIFNGWSLSEFVTLTKLEILMFIPYNTLAFKFVPPKVRPLTHASISATFNIAVSAVTLGYFDTWVNRAGHWFQ